MLWCTLSGCLLCFGAVFAYVVHPRIHARARERVRACARACALSCVRACVRACRLCACRRRLHLLLLLQASPTVDEDFESYTSFSARFTKSTYLSFSGFVGGSAVQPRSVPLRVAHLGAAWCMCIDTCLDMCLICVSTCLMSHVCVFLGHEVRHACSWTVGYQARQVGACGQAFV